jgi:hypothetical protein
LAHEPLLKRALGPHPAGGRGGEVFKNVRADKLRGLVVEKLRRPAIHAQ